jgi:hypothetical protein
MLKITPLSMMAEGGVFKSGGCGDATGKGFSGNLPVGKSPVGSFPGYPLDGKARAHTCVNYPPGLQILQPDKVCSMCSTVFWIHALSSFPDLRL